MSHTKDLTINWRAKAHFVSIISPENGGSVRNVFKHRWTHKGRTPVDGRNVNWEGKNERLGIWFERFVRRSTDFISQPETLIFEIDGQLVEHLPDYRLQRAGVGFVRLQFKGISAFAYWPGLAEKLKAIGRAYADGGYRFEVVSSRQLYAQPLAANVDEIWRARRVPVSPDVRGRIRDALSLGPRTVGDMVALCGPGDPRRVFSLHASDDLTIALGAGPISADSEVTAGAFDLGPYARSIP